MRIRNYDIRPCVSAAEAKLFYADAHRGRPDYVGCCRGYFRNGGFYNTWLDAEDEGYALIRDDVRALMTAFIEDGPLRGRAELCALCKEHETARVSAGRDHFGFVVVTGLCAYYVNFNTSPGDYCMYVYCRLKGGDEDERKRGYCSVPG